MSNELARRRAVDISADNITWVRLIGTAARVWVRWYDRNGKPDAKTGQAIVEWNQSKSAAGDVEEITVLFKGDGAITGITNPGNSTLPVVMSATPSGLGAGALLTIGGQYLTGPVVTTGVKVGGVNATSWTVVSDTTIVAVMPAGSAGSAPVLVTTAAGASNSFPYTRT